MPRKKMDGFNFETAMVDLEAIVEGMEEGDLSLEQAMEEFEKGVKITRQCHQALQKAEQKVKLLIEKQGEFELADFSTGEFDEEEDEDE